MQPKKGNQNTVPGASPNPGAKKGTFLELVIHRTNSHLVFTLDSRPCSCGVSTNPISQRTRDLIFRDWHAVKDNLDILYGVEHLRCLFHIYRLKSIAGEKQPVPLDRLSKGDLIPAGEQVMTLEFLVEG